MTFLALLAALLAQDLDTNNATIWELQLEPDITVSFGDMTQAECETLRSELLEELDSKYINLLKCVEVPVKREST